jgi:hypothetical protein
VALLRSSRATFSPVEPVWVFLGSGGLAAKTLVYGGWKGLDFLGFSRPNRASSVGYAGFSLKEISRALFPPRQNRGTAAPILACGKGRTGHGESLIQFLVFCKELLSEPFLLA